MASNALRQDQVTVSVVIPVHNRERTIGYCLESVLSQSYSPMEILVVDDCSDDRTAEVVASYKDKRVRWLPMQHRSGAQAARNRGIKAACGDWIAFLDSDDEWLPEKLEAQVASLCRAGRDPYLVVHGNALRYDYRAGTQELWTLTQVHGRQNEVLPQVLREPGPMFQALLVSRTALLAIGLLDELVPSYQEWDTAIRLAERCAFLHLKQPLFVYHLHEGETISSNLRRDLVGYQYVIEKHRETIGAVCASETWMRHLVYQLRRHIRFGFGEEAEAYLERHPGLAAYYAAVCNDSIVDLLNDGRWEECDTLFTRATGRSNWKTVVLRFCRYLHLRPRALSTLARLLLHGADTTGGRR